MKLPEFKNPVTLYRGLPRDIYSLWIARIIDSAGSYILPFVVLILTQKIGMSKKDAGIFSTVFMLLQAPFLLMGGRLIDHIGSKKVVVLFSLAGAATYLPCAFIRPSLRMAGLIALAATFFTVASPALSAIVSEITPDHSIKRAYSLLFLGVNLGNVIGPAISGLLFNRFLNVLFFLDAATGAAAAAVIWFFVHAGERVREREPQIGKEKLSSYRFLLKAPVLLWFSAILLFFNFAYAQWGYMLPLQSADLFGSGGARFYSMLVSVSALTVILMTPVLTSLTHSFSTVSTAGTGGAFYLMSFILFGIGRPWPVFVLGAICLTIGQIMISVNANIFIVEHTPRDAVGRANSVLSLVNGAGVAIGPILMGHLLLILSFRQAWMLVAVLMLFGSVAMFALRERYLMRA